MSDNIIHINKGFKPLAGTRERSIYIAGPMTGFPQFNFSEFDDARDRLSRLGYITVYSPADQDRERLGKEIDWMPSHEDVVEGWNGFAIPDKEGDMVSRDDLICEGISWILDNASSIYMLRHWEGSSGARAEHAVSVALGLEIIYE